ncbi:MAG: hypothetical protein ACXVA3_17165 [Vulcanimicrobiaceae bacterium]
MTAAAVLLLWRKRQRTISLFGDGREYDRQIKIAGETMELFCVVWGVNRMVSMLTIAEFDFGHSIEVRCATKLNAALEFDWSEEPCQTVAIKALQGSPTLRIGSLFGLLTEASQRP